MTGTIFIEKIPVRSNVIKLTKNSVPQVGGELANPNEIDDVGVRKLAANLEQAGSLA